MEKEGLRQEILRWLNKKIMKGETVVEPVVDLYDKTSFIKGHFKGYQKALKDVREKIKFMKEGNGK